MAPYGLRPKAVHQKKGLIRTTFQIKAQFLTERIKKSCRIRRDRDKQRQQDSVHLQAILPPDQLGIVTGVHVPAQVLVEINQAIVEEDIPLRDRQHKHISFVLLSLSDRCSKKQQETRAFISQKPGTLSPSQLPSS